MDALKYEALYGRSDSGAAVADVGQAAGDGKASDDRFRVLLDPRARDPEHSGQTLCVDRAPIGARAFDDRVGADTEFSPIKRNRLPIEGGTKPDGLHTRVHTHDLKDLAQRHIARTQITVRNIARVIHGQIKELVLDGADIDGVAE